MADQQKMNFRALRDKAGPFPPEAFEFVRRGLQHTVEVLHGAPEATLIQDEGRHVTGQQLCLGLRDYALRQYGLLARTVLERWGIRRTDDFGKIVFAMIEAGLMRKTEEDTIDDFRAVYDFGEAFAAVEIDH